MSATTPLCSSCGRPIAGSAVWVGVGIYHPECCHPPGYSSPTFQPPPLTADQVRQIIREELERARGVKGEGNG